MKSLIMVAMMAAVTFAFVGCKKEETPGAKIDKALKSAGQSADKATKDAKKATDAAAKDTDKAAVDLQKKLDGALKK